MSRDCKGDPSISPLHEESQGNLYDDSFLSFLHDVNEKEGTENGNGKEESEVGTAGALSTPSEYSCEEDPFPSADEQDKEEDSADEGDEENEEALRARAATASLQALESYSNEDPFPSADEDSDEEKEK